MAITYQSSGVDYGPLDAFKRACQREAAGTVAALAAHGITEPPAVRGESAYLLETPHEFLAHVEEGLGTKNLIADAMLEKTGESFYAAIGIDTVATIVNDLITCGALPLSVAMHAAVGDAAFFSKGTRGADLARGFAEGCRQAGAVWGGGETPALKGIVDPKTIVLAGSAIGRIQPKSARIIGDLRDGDAIVLLPSSGVHTNGLTLCRAVADQLSGGYLTPLPSGRTFGQALLDPSIIYVRFMIACRAAGIHLKYTAHITGHGWRKLMRLDEPFIYRITDIGRVPEVLKFVQQQAGLDDREAWGTFNMGAGFAVYVSADDVPACLMAAKSVGLDGWLGGTVQAKSGRKAVEIVPLGVTYEAESLQLRS